MILQRKVFDGAIVVFREEFPQASIWEKVCKEFLCLELMNAIDDIEPGDKRYIEYPCMQFYSSKTWGCIRGSFFDPSHNFTEDIIGNSRAFYRGHDCDSTVLEMDGFGLQEYMDKSDGRFATKVPIVKGKLWQCKCCGETYFFDDIPPEELLNLYRTRMGISRVT